MRIFYFTTILLFMFLGCDVNKKSQQIAEELAHRDRPSIETIEKQKHSKMLYDINHITPIKLNVFDEQQLGKVQEKVIVGFVTKRVMSPEDAKSKGYELVEASPTRMVFQKNNLKLEIQEFEFVIDTKRLGDGRRLGKASYAVTATSKEKKEVTLAFQTAFIAYIEKDFVEVYDTDVWQELTK